MVRASADGFIASYPKSGRTWLRFILANYLDAVLDLGLEVDFRSMFQLIPNDVVDRERGFRAYRYRFRRDVPFLVMSHQPFHRAVFGSTPVLLMVREPKDVLVSFYFHESRHRNAYKDGIKAFIRDEDSGTGALCRYLNGWARALVDRPHLVLSYESLKSDPADAMRRVIDFFAIEPDEEALARALEVSSFESMRAVERRTAIPGPGYDRDDQNGVRVRRGRIGGYGEVLDPDDVTFVDRTCATMLEPAAATLLRRSIPNDAGRAAFAVAS
jgi:hypothetical protein